MQKEQKRELELIAARIRKYGVQAVKDANSVLIWG